MKNCKDKIYQYVSDRSWAYLNDYSDELYKGIFLLNNNMDFVKYHISYLSDNELDHDYNSVFDVIKY